MGLLPLEFYDCLTDSPYFRDNLHAHEKELERTSQSIKGLTKDVKDLINAAKNLSKAQRNFGQSLLNFKFECIGNSQTDDEIIIARSLKGIGKLILQIEEERDRVLDSANDNFIEPLEKFRKEHIGVAKEGKKKFEKETAKFCQSLDRNLTLSSKKNETIFKEADATLEMEQYNFSRASLEYIYLLQEVQERKKFEFVETILGFMYSWLTFYHQGHEVGKDFKSFMTDLQIRIQKTRENFDVTRSQAKTLMNKNLEGHKTPCDPGSLCKMYTRQGYLFLQEKKTISTTWNKTFCQYQKENRRFNMIPYLQSVGKITSTDTMVLKTCVRRSSESIDRRFCFDITVEDRPGVFTLQALSEKDCRLWLDAMDGKEPTYTPPGKLAKQEESLLDDIGFAFVKKSISVLEERGLEDQGLYRLVGVNSKVQKLLQVSLDKKLFDEKGLEDINDSDTKTITSALKSYFRNLPEPVMTYKRYQDFINATQQESVTERVDQIHILIHGLPQPNFKMIDILINHLCNVASKSDKNLMTVSNIGVCFGPTVLRSEEETMAAIMDIKFCNIVIEILIENYDKIFKSIPQESFEVLGSGKNQAYQGMQHVQLSSNEKEMSNYSANGGRAIVTSFMKDVPMSVQIPDIPPPPSVVSRQNTWKGNSSMQPPPVAPIRASRSVNKQPLAFINPSCQNETVNTAPSCHSSTESISSSSKLSSINSSLSSLSSKTSYSGRPTTLYQKSTRPDYLSKSPPVKSSPSSGRRVRTLYACVGGNEHELTFEPNQLIENVKPSRDPGWLEGTLGGKTGLIPGNYIEYIPKDSDFT